MRYKPLKRVITQVPRQAQQPNANATVYTILSREPVHSSRVLKKSFLDGQSTRLTAAKPIAAPVPVKAPSGVAIPSWAYLDVEINDTFDFDMAKSPALSYLEPRAPSDPEDSTPTLSSTEPFTLSGTTHDSSSTSAEFDTDDSTDSDAEQHDPEDRTRPIVGGVVGAASALILLIGLVVYCLRRRRKKAMRRAVSIVSATTLPSHLTSRNGSNNLTDDKTSSQSPV
ncbi:hypothetical protein NMY22_g889 [Coprinellus aureogranulatus]|nr:hypothetical protein NMY22_g889 [Coprinellus aureogranulatus]